MNPTPRSGDRYADIRQARAGAWHLARAMRSDAGVEHLPSPLDPAHPWRIFMLPPPAHRAGYETRCEVIRPTDPEWCADV